MHEAEPALRPSVAPVGRHPEQTACLVVVFPLLCAMPLSGDIHDLVSVCVHGGSPHVYLRQKSVSYALHCTSMR